MIKTFTCKVCGESFQKETRSYAYYCPTCRKKKNVEKVMSSKKRKIPETMIGVGSGGNQKGDKNPGYKGGHTVYRQTYLESETGAQSCEICNSGRHLLIHHRDGNRSNGHLSNLIRLCRKCHAKVHKLHQNFKEPK